MIFAIAGLASVSLHAASSQASNSYSINAAQSSFILSWIPNNNIGVIIIARANALPDDPGNYDSYSANAVYGEGSAAGNGFVIFKGGGNRVNVSGLTPGTVYYFSMYETDATGFLTNTFLNYSAVNLDLDNNFSDDAKTSMTSALTSNSINCGTIMAGLTCTLDGSSSSPYSAGPAPCNTGAFTGSNPWDGASCTGYISWNFSVPISKITVRMIAVNTAPENTTISQAGGTGGTLSLSAVTCMASAGLVLGPYTGSGYYGDVAVTISSTGTFTRITCTNTGCNSGWVSVCATNAVLPIELLSFKAQCSGPQVDLAWKTATEKDNDFFAVERSVDAVNWEILEKIPGAGNSASVLSYNYSDVHPLRSTAYYRLRQVDFNGTDKYSETISTEGCNGATLSGIYPNPASHEVIVKAAADGSVFELYNMYGLKVMSRSLQAGENRINVSELGSGTYQATILNDKTSSGPGKLMINN